MTKQPAANYFEAYQQARYDSAFAEAQLNANPCPRLSERCDQLTETLTDLATAIAAAPVFTWQDMQAKLTLIQDTAGERLLDMLQPSAASEALSSALRWSTIQSHQHKTAA